MGSKLILFPLSPARLMAPIIVSVPFAASRKVLFFAPPRESQSFQPRSRLTLLARASDLDEREAAQFPMCLRSCLRGRKSGARLLASRMDAVCVKSEDTCRPGGYCHEIGVFQMGHPGLKQGRES